MPVAGALGKFTSAVSQCDNLIANAHRTDGTGANILPELDRRQITVAAFLNLYIAWETFLEEMISALLCGASTLNGTIINKFASPPDQSAARSMLVGVNRYFDYGNHDNIIKIANIFFQQGAPFQPHLASIHSQLSDMRTMRNSSAHISSTTQAALEALALRLLNRPAVGIELYDLLTAIDPSGGGGTIFQTYRDTLTTTAGLIANG